MYKSSVLSTALFLGLAVVLCIGCTKGPATVIEKPEYLYGTGTGESKDKQTALDIAKHAARLDIAQQVQTKVEQSVEEIDARTTVASKQTTSVTLHGCEVVKETVEKDGFIYRAYVEMKMPVKAPAAEIREKPTEMIKKEPTSKPSSRYSFSEGDYWQVAELTSSSMTIHIPAGAERNSWIAAGKFAAYTGSEDWRWTVLDAGESEVEIHPKPRPGMRPSEMKDLREELAEKHPSFAITLNFEPRRPKPPSFTSPQEPRRGPGGEWCPYPYITPRYLKRLEGISTEKIDTPMGAIECYKVKPRLTFIRPVMPPPDMQDRDQTIINLGPAREVTEAFLWYEVRTGVMVKEEVKTDKGEVLESLIKETNIELDVLEK